MKKRRLMKRYEEIEHSADWAFRAYGRDLQELFENAARALFALEGAPPLPPEIAHKVQVSGIDYEALLVNWLSELLYLQETRGETYSEFEIDSLTPTDLLAVIQGATSRPLNKLVKAVTYHGLKIEQTPDGWQATVVVDV